MKIFAAIRDMIHYNEATIKRDEQKSNVMFKRHELLSVFL